MPLQKRTRPCHACNGLLHRSPYMSTSNREPKQQEYNGQKITENLQRVMALM